MDTQSLRLDTPGCEEIVHFNNADCALRPAIVNDTLIGHLQAEQRLGGYEAAQAAAEPLADFYRQLALLLGCQSDEIAYVENATRAWDMAVHSIPWQEGDEILVGQNEYVSNYLGLLNLQQRYRLSLRVVPLLDDGLLDLDQLQRLVSKHSKAIFLTHVASQCGDIQDAQAVGAIAQQHGLWYVLDACQSAGQIKLETEALGCDFLCGTGRKYLRGPRGSGFLFASRRRIKETSPVFVDLQAAAWPEPQRFELRDDARRFETWERNIAGQLGLREAVAYANRLGSESIERRVKELAASLRQQLSDSGHCRVFERTARASGIVTFQHERLDATALQARLSEHSVNTSVCRAANAQLDLAPAGQGDLNRASLHYYNDEAEIERFVGLLAGF